jgi:hypothetical protein
MEVLGMDQQIGGMKVVLGQNKLDIIKKLNVRSDTHVTPRVNLYVRIRWRLAAPMQIPNIANGPPYVNSV